MVDGEYGWKKIINMETAANDCLYNVTRYEFITDFISLENVINMCVY